MSGVRAEIIAVGSEMLTETRVDTNSLWLTGEINKLGVELSQKCVVGDDRDLLAAAVAGAMERAPLVLITGGLGPTEDDVTREAVAQAMHRRLLFSEEICRGIEAIFERRGRKMAEINRRQAFLVDGAEPLENPNGTAPGQWIDCPGGMVLLLPGPPRELKPMFENLCLPRLRERLLQGRGHGSERRRRSRGSDLQGVHEPGDHDSGGCRRHPAPLAGAVSK
jgi:nicotinamide-nucleotide amidase